jgi:hypothetical protein
MNLINTVKNLIFEKLGVPDNIAEVAEVLYDKIIERIHNNIPIEELVEEKFNIRLNTEVGGMPIRDFNIGFSFEEYPENVLGGMQHQSDSKTTDEYRIKTEKSSNIVLIINILGSSEMNGSDVKNLLPKEKTVSILAHEIKHHYDDYNKEYEGYKKRVDYTSKSNVRIGRISTVNDLILDMYYIHSIENLVRPSELYSLIKSGKISREQFYKFFTEHEIFKKLKNIRNTTYQSFIQKLKDNIDEIKKAFDDNDIDYDGLTDDQIINRVLDITITNLSNFKASGMQDLLSGDFYTRFFGISGKKKKYFENYLASLEFNLKNPELFFKKEIKIMNILADKMIKKLSKLYDMTETGNETNLTEIIKTHDENPLPKTKFDTHYKYWSKEKKHPIKK